MNNILKMALAASVLASATMASAVVYNSNETNVRVPATGTGGTTAASYSSMTFTVTGSGPITSISFTMDWGTREDTVDSPGKEHTFAGDLDMLLVAPDGTRVVLMSDMGGGGDLNGVYTIADGGGVWGATANLAPGTYATAGSLVNEMMGPLGSTNQAAGTMATFNGINANGTWTLHIQDDAGGDFGYMNSASLNIEAVPEPATMTALALGAAAMLRRRRK